MTSEASQRTPARRPLTFIVGTGRTGSTALTQILHQHPDVLSLSELTRVIGHRGFPPGALSGEQFWRLLAEPHQVCDAMIRSGIPAPEFCYLDHPTETARFGADRGGIPAISLMTLPRLTSDPDGLYDRLASAVSGWPVQDAASHHLRLHDTLCDWLNRKVVVERSGYSLGAVPMLRAFFPHARFVHMYRAGPDCALSMSRSPIFRVLLLLLEVVDLTSARDLDSLENLSAADLVAVPAHLVGLLADRFDPRIVMDLDVPVSRFGALWSRLILEGLTNLAVVPTEQRANLSYEALLDDPGRELSRLAEFIGVPASEDWLHHGRSFLDPGRRGASARLAAAELADLRQACGPALDELRSAA